MKPGKAVPVQKRGGARRPMRRKTKQLDKLTPVDYYKDQKGASIFPKRLGQYRFLICTDLEPDDMAALAMFTAWVRVNEQYFDSRSSFPIYGFLVGENRYNKRVQAQRAREFLQRFAEILGWDNRDHHLYNGFNNAGYNIWFDGKSNTPFDTESELVNNQEALTDDNYPDPQPFDLVGIEQLMTVSPKNLFILYLKPIRFFQSLQNRPEVFEHLRKIPGAMYGSWNVQSVLEEAQELTIPILNFLNRTHDDAPLVYTESYLALGEKNSMNHENSSTLFRELDEAEEGELAEIVNRTMFTWNDNLVEKLQREPEFAGTDFDDYQVFTSDLLKLSLSRAEELRPTIKIVDSILKYGSRTFSCADMLVIVGMLIGSRTLTKSPFRLQPSQLGYNGRFMHVTIDSDSNTFVLLPKNDSPRKPKKFLAEMLLAAFDIVNK